MIYQFKSSLTNYLCALIFFLLKLYVFILLTEAENIANFSSIKQFNSERSKELAKATSINIPTLATHDAINKL